MFSVCKMSPNYRKLYTVLWYRIVANTILWSIFRLSSNTVQSQISPWFLHLEVVFETSEFSVCSVYYVVLHTYFIGISMIIQWGQSCSKVWFCWKIINCLFVLQSLELFLEFQNSMNIIVRDLKISLINSCYLDLK